MQKEIIKILETTGNDIQIRKATPEDAGQLQKIYSYYVENTAITFEYEPPTPEEFKNRIVNTIKKYPYFCVLKNGILAGYAYAGAFHERKAYQWSAEMTIYLTPDARRGGLGRILYGTLEEALRKMGIQNLYACIAYPENEDEYLTKDSVNFHEHLGYQMVGKLHNCGYKFGRWYHMVYMEKIIGRHENIPQELEYSGNYIDGDL